MIINFSSMNKKYTREELSEFSLSRLEQIKYCYRPPTPPQDLLMNRFSHIVASRISPVVASRISPVVASRISPAPKLINKAFIYSKNINDKEKDKSKRIINSILELQDKYS